MTFLWDPHHLYAKRLDQACDELTELMSLLELAAHGVGYALSAVRVTDALRGGPSWTRAGVTDDEYYRRRLRAEREQQLARAQSDSGLATYCGYTAVQMWGVLEASIDDFCGELALVAPDGIIEAWRGLPGPILSILTADDAERVWLVATALKDKGKVRSNAGVDRFEPVLEALSLPRSNLHAAVERRLVELCAVRNVIVHRRGLVDAKFMRLCPWLRKCVGDRILVDRGTLAIWYSALLTYLFDIDVRLAELAGVPQYSRAFRDDMQAHVIGGDRN